MTLHRKISMFLLVESPNFKKQSGEPFEPQHFVRPEQSPLWASSHTPPSQTTQQDAHRRCGDPCLGEGSVFIFFFTRTAFDGWIIRVENQQKITWCKQNTKSILLKFLVFCSQSLVNAAILPPFHPHKWVWIVGATVATLFPNYLIMFLIHGS